jgi:hypothetical protein
VFFPSGDAMGRDYEWWTGVAIGHEHTASGSLA